MTDDKFYLSGEDIINEDDVQDLNQEAREAQREDDSEDEEGQHNHYADFGFEITDAHYNPPYQKNQLHRELLNVLGFAPFDRNNSASRKQMLASHLSQLLVPIGTNKRRIITGVEREYGKYTFNIKMPCDAEIIAKIPRYHRTIAGDGPTENPETLIIYENYHTKEVSCLMLPKFFSYHGYFGFRYNETKAYKTLRQGAVIHKDTVLLESPNIDDQGNYNFGRECNVAFMTHPSVSEDGIGISRDVLKHFTIRKYETRVVDFGEKYFPINAYGTADKYKPYPEIGEMVRSDGVLAVLRSFEGQNAPSEQSRLSTLNTDHFGDRKVYAPLGKIVDIKVMHDPESALPLTPVGMEVQSQRYDDARREYYDTVLKELNRLKHERGDKFKPSVELDRLGLEATSVKTSMKDRRSADKDAPERVIKLHRSIPLDDYRLEFTIETEAIPNIGFKFTDGHG